ncbi:NAD(P)/FAD-dependent oxidoreductase [Paenibacillus sp. FSL R7-0210]|uniref:NAD(P)/FAD-dependent oxidoreductase n=1 Tax=Paenibacillus sp. FSL R7-0210 TaxID=2921676 RepID=UPI0030FBEAF4
MIYDCVIVGGGPAGLNAALVLGRARRRVALIDNNKPRNAVTHASHGFITRDGIAPSEFRSIAYEELQSYPSVEHIKTEIHAVKKVGSEFWILDDSSESIRARKVILATGLREIFQEIDGFKELYGKSLFNCPYCDGWELRDQPLVIVAEPAAIMHVAKLMYTWSKDLLICTNGKEANLENKHVSLLESKAIRVQVQPIRSFIGENGLLHCVQFQDGTTIPRSGGFIFPQFKQSLSFVEELGLERTVSEGIQTDEAGRTSIAGLYAAGDAAYIQPSQLIYAAADGSRTAISVNLDLADEDFR